ncbi:MAG: glutathione S-transferase family protein [Hyphomonadaceae bacterium]
MSLKLHVFPLSPRAFKVLLVAEHLKLPYEFCLCDLTKGEQKSAAFTAINLNQKMPGRLQALGIQCDHPVPREQETRRTAAARRTRASGRLAVDVLGIDHMGSGRRHPGVRARGERPIRIGRP